MPPSGHRFPVGRRLWSRIDSPNPGESQTRPGTPAHWDLDVDPTITTVEQAERASGNKRLSLRPDSEKTFDFMWLVLRRREHAAELEQRLSGLWCLDLKIYHYFESRYPLNPDMAECIEQHTCGIHLYLVSIPLDHAGLADKIWLCLMKWDYHLVWTSSYRNMEPRK
ncbi:hypothetical protein O9K51_01220 [Purpureocillium lavendulum]|uniref:Uncharacterized protein n=1 Tax=Purpureocillium lavendulum TaxID=1247861 RepID=A0AB34G6T4_9HYPO|nr:hypothetical protein O9K51_01220 [Purpureocillium lavendulum]